MMLNVVCLEKEDIKSEPIGNNFWIKVNDNFAISFTREAAEELVKDFNAMLNPKPAKKAKKAQCQKQKP